MRTLIFCILSFALLTISYHKVIAGTCQDPAQTQDPTACATQAPWTVICVPAQADPTTIASPALIKEVSLKLIISSNDKIWPENCEFIVVYPVLNPD